MYAHPGKKINFYGTGNSSSNRMNDEKALDWLLFDFPNHNKSTINSLESLIRFIYRILVYGKMMILWQGSGMEYS